MIALVVMSIIVPAALTLGWASSGLGITAQRELTEMSASSTLISNGVVDQVNNHQDSYAQSWGRDVCTIVPARTIGGSGGPAVTVPTENFLGSAASITDTSLVARNGFVYEDSASTVRAQSDFFIIDARAPTTPTLISSLNTGPGLGKLTVVGHYVFAANESSISQLIVIDIANRHFPVVVGKLKLPLPFATSTAPAAHSIFYSNGFIYLGTEKWDGDEFNVIDVTDPAQPHYLGGFKTGTLVNDIYVTGGYAYIADADAHQMRVLDIRNPSQIQEVGFFSPSGSSVLEGKSLSVFMENSTTTLLYLGRDGGGFNNPNQFELYSFNLTSDPFLKNPLAYKDIPGGVYGIEAVNGYVILATRATNTPLQIWDSSLAKEIYSSGPNVNLANLTGMVCTHTTLYIPTISSGGFVIITSS